MGATAVWVAECRKSPGTFLAVACLAAIWIGYEF
jgi:hypothetical protein